jgi:hypothetical protein
MGFFFTIGNTCYWQLMPAMIYDVCEVDELASGKKRSGEVVSLQALSESVYLEALPMTHPAAFGVRWSERFLRVCRICEHPL